MKRAFRWALPGCAIAASLTVAMLAAPAGAAGAGTLNGTAGSPFPGRLYSVSAVSARDVWAAGLNPGGSLLLHWNGSAWSQYLTSPGYFTGVAASSARDAWAVGLAGPGPGVPSSTAPLIEHWNGNRWKVIPSPNPPSGYLNILNAASAVSRDIIWAVGTTDYASTLVVHWDGTSWS